MKKSEKLMVISTVIIMVVILILGFTYAYFVYDKKEDNPNKYKTACYSISFDEEKEGILINNAYPISDDDGFKQEPYILAMTNNCDTALGYNAYLHITNESTTDPTTMRVAVNDKVQDLLDYTQVSPTLENTQAAYLLKTDYIEPKESVTLEFRSWMSALSTTGENTKFVNKISVDIIDDNR